MRRLKRKRCPREGKIIFRDEIAAKIALGHIRAAILRERKEQRAYACGNHWHLTSQDERKVERG
jgi:hypothetical protein